MIEKHRALSRNLAAELKTAIAAHTTRVADVREARAAVDPLMKEVDRLLAELERLVAENEQLMMEFNMAQQRAADAAEALAAVVPPAPAEVVP